MFERILNTPLVRCWWLQLILVTCIRFLVVIIDVYTSYTFFLLPRPTSLLPEKDFRSWQQDLPLEWVLRAQKLDFWWGIWCFVLKKTKTWFFKQLLLPLRSKDCKKDFNWNLKRPLKNCDQKTPDWRNWFLNIFSNSHLFLKEERWHHGSYWLFHDEGPCHKAKIFTWLIIYDKSYTVFYKIRPFLSIMINHIWFLERRTMLCISD